MIPSLKDEKNGQNLRLGKTRPFFVDKETARFLIPRTGRAVKALLRSPLRSALNECPPGTQRPLMIEGLGAEVRLRALSRAAGLLSGLKDVRCEKCRGTEDFSGKSCVTDIACS